MPKGRVVHKDVQLATHPAQSLDSTSEDAVTTQRNLKNVSVST
jgi:hypothetical protein